MEEHLFGTSDGDEANVGALRAAGRGTLALIDVPALPLHVQARLAEAIATRTLVQGTTLHPFHARIVMTATRALAPSETESLDTSEGALLPIDGELQKRLASQSIRIPRLHERLEDIPSLALLAIDRACRTQGIPPLGIAEDALAWLIQHAVHDGEAGLERVLMRAVRRAKPPRLHAHDLQALTNQRVIGEDPLDATLAELEERALLRALQRADGNKSEAARMLGLKRTTFLDKLRRLGLDDESDRPSA
jgi:DNA-binding NtrC family response regulator